jgi:hypothetical protein
MRFFLPISSFAPFGRCISPEGGKALIIIIINASGYARSFEVKPRCTRLRLELRPGGAMHFFKKSFQPIGWMHLQEPGVAKLITDCFSSNSLGNL